MKLLAALLLAACTVPPAPRADPQPPADAAPLRVRQAGIVIGALPTGPSNAITDVAGVAVGHATVVRGTAVRTGVTVVVPHSGNLFRDKVPAAVFVANGFGKLVGSTQIVELGELESPIALTNTLSVGRVADALVGHVLALPGNESVRSVNVVVGETNDGFLNDIRGRHVGAEHLEQALRNARGGPVVEGGVGAGAGTVCFGWKGGIGTASRRVSEFTVGVLVQTNFGGALTVAGVPVHRTLRAPRRQRTGDGSCMIVIATDAPLGARNLRRLAARAFAGMARTGASFANGSGDYAIAFSTATSQRIRAGAPRSGGPVLANPRMSPLFLAVAEATEEAILNSLFAARRVSGARGVVEALPVERVVALVRGR